MLSGGSAALIYKRWRGVFSGQPITHRATRNGERISGKDPPELEGPPIRGNKPVGVLV